MSFIGTPFTADGIMSHLQGGTDDISYRPPGIWSTVSQAENPHEAPSFEAPYYATTPFADKGNAGLHDSIHVGSGKITARHRPRNDQSSQSPVRYHPEHTASECQPDLEPKAAIGFFLLQIESDLVSCLLPLLYQKWLADPEAVSKGIQDPSRVQGLNGVESALWDCLKHNISEILPRDISGEEIELRIKTRDLSDRWISWCQWAVPGQANQSHRAIKPNPEDLSSFLDAWTTIWQGILKFSVNYRSDYGTYARTTWNWKALAKSVGEHLV